MATEARGRADYVAGGEDPRATGPPLGVHDDPAAPVDLDPGLLQAQARSADAAARREQQRVRAQLPAIIQLDGQVIAVPAHRRHPGAEDHLVPSCQQDLLEPPGDLAVHHRGQPRGGVYDGDRHTERGDDGGVLHSDRECRTLDRAAL